MNLLVQLTLTEVKEMKKILSITLLAIFFGLMLTVVPTTHAQAPTPGSECSNATEFVTITSGPGLKFDKSSISVTKDTCVQITLVNADTMLHDFAIDDVSGDNGINQVYVAADIGVTASFNVTTPNTDVTFQFYCWQPGHKAAGMVGDFIVGEGSPESDSPAFGFWITLGAFLSIAILIPRLRK
ncbi:MAG: hypothetical protein HeimC2_04340 [Candidatus Heimdallarchaeota archaeon LC_2]|nr:MAG: hypothetical protein HeimC2_04340 [Candidatus Heimdallarchaeota archaeon LC_2]